MPHLLSKRESRPIAMRSMAMIFLASVLCLATLGLAWLGYRATMEWRSTTDLLIERSANEKLALLIGALNRDMKGALFSVILDIHHDQLTLEVPHELADDFARAFARFPYPEFFFAWKATREPRGLSYSFTRGDRPPAWHAEWPAIRYPVVMLKDPPEMREVIAVARQEGARGNRLAVFDRELTGSPYQFVVHILQSDTGGAVGGLVGYGVNLDWVREHYFAELTRQVSRIGGMYDDMSLAIVDHLGRVVTATKPAAKGEAVRERSFRLAFFDPGLAPASFDRSSIKRWTARVSVADDSGLLVDVGSKRILTLISIAAVAALVGLALAVRAVYVTAEVVAMKSDFISTVTHELKTPLSIIRLVGETLAMGRYKNSTTIHDYALLLSEETSRLTLLIDNLLAYARISEVNRAYTFESLDVATLVEEAVRRHHPRLAELGFEVKLHLPVLSPVSADKLALLHVLDNVIDNAIKYSPGTRVLDLRAEADDAGVRIRISDRGTGIPEAEIPRVFERFFRGSRAGRRGSGLGLAISRRIVQEHGGNIEIESVEGTGTSVLIRLPAVREICSVQKNVKTFSGA